MNRLKRYTIIGILFVCIAGTLSHFIYAWTGQNFLAGLFTPVNESTWEHMKLVFFPMMIFSAWMEHKLSKEYPCILSSLCFGMLSGTWLVAVFFYSYSGILGYHSLPWDIAVFIASVLAAFLIAYRCTLRCSVSKWQTLLLVATLAMLVCFMAFSYHPPGLGIFDDPAAGATSAAFGKHREAL